MPQSIIVTLISADGLAPGDGAIVRAAIEASGREVVSEMPIDLPYATDIVVRGPDAARLRPIVERVARQFDVICQPHSTNRRRRLLVADMDSTMIGQECIDELADFAGLKAEIAAITDAAMHGKLDFVSALKKRVAALKGLSESAITTCLAERIHVTPGARTLIATMKKLGAHTCLVSGGFTAFTSVIAAEIGFDEQHANILGIRDGHLDGTVDDAIVDSGVKRHLLMSMRDQRGLPRDATLAVGDGANDIGMLEEAGLGVAYHAKPATQQAADAAIRFGDLRTLLWAQGIPRREWVDLG